MENKTNEEYDVESYLDAFSFFKMNKPMIQEFTKYKNLEQNENENKIFSETIDNINNMIIINKEDTDEIKQQKKYSKINLKKLQIFY